MVLGIVSLFFNFFYVPGILAIIWGGRERAESSKARAGFICGIIGTALSVAGTLLFLLLIAGAGNAVDSAASAPVPTADLAAPAIDAPDTADDPAVEPPAPAAPASTFGEGTHRVGVDIAPGTYRSPGGDLCYWERQASFGSGDVEDIIANEISTGGQVVVTIEPSDMGFKTSGCGTFTPA